MVSRSECSPPVAIQDKFHHGDTETRRHGEEKDIEQKQPEGAEQILGEGPCNQGAPGIFASLACLSADLACSCDAGRVSALVFSVTPCLRDEKWLSRREPLFMM